MRLDWPTLALICLSYAALALALLVLPGVSLAIAIGLTALVVTLHASLQHEILHREDPAERRLGIPLLFASLNLAIPYLRFRDTHLAHHRDARLTDPYDDPETQYLDPATWARLSRTVQGMLRANNTLLGRMVLGPALAQASFMASDWRLWRSSAPEARGIAAAWAAHIVASATILAVVWASPMPVWAYLVACYLGLSILKIRTFLEHQAHTHAGARSVIIEDRGLLAFLFLNNNLHVVHHMNPSVRWYRLPRLYARNSARYLSRNGGYRYRSYAQVFAAYLFHAKEPVAHPLYPPAQK